METEGAKNYFEPDRLVIQPGDTIRWILESGVHSATAYHPDNAGKPLRIPENATAWNSGILSEQGAEFEHTFSEEGVYDYFCIRHEALGMIGTSFEPVYPKGMKSSSKGRFQLAFEIANIAICLVDVAGS